MEAGQWERFVDKRRNTLHLCFHSNYRFLSLSVSLSSSVLFTVTSVLCSLSVCHSLFILVIYNQSLLKSASVPGIRCAITLLQRFLSFTIARGDYKHYTSIILPLPNKLPDPKAWVSTDGCVTIVCRSWREEMSRCVFFYPFVG